MTDRLLHWLGETSWQVAVLVVLVLVLQALFGRRLAPRWRYALWLLVFVRLLVPVQPSVPAGIWRDELRPASWTAYVEPAASKVPLGHMQVSVEGPAETAKDALRAPASPVAAPDPTLGQGAAAARERGASTRKTPREARSPVAIAPVSLETEPGSAPSDSQGVSPVGILVALYLAGLAFCLVRLAAIELFFRRRLRGARRITDGRVQELLQEARGALGVRRPVELFETDAVSSPAVLGLRRPRLLLPLCLANQLGDQELRLVILHELAHVRRGDVALGAVLALVQSLYWFHPLVHLAAKRLQAAQESVRDWEALSTDGASSPRSYANTLIKLLEGSPERNARRVPFGAAGLFSSRGQLKRRILMIARFDSAPRGRLLGSGLLLALGWVAFTSAAPTPIPQPEMAHTEETAEDDQDLRSLVVERHEQPAPWKDELRQKLTEPVSVGLEAASLHQVIQLLRTSTGTNFVAPQGLLDDYEGDRFTLVVENKSLEQVLAILCRMAGDGDLGYTLYREAIYLGYAYELPETFELRFYNVDELLSETEGEMSGEDHLIDMIRTFVGPEDCWESEQASIGTWNDLLVISQTDERHDEVERFLERLLNDGKKPSDRAPVWRQELEKALEQVIDVDFSRVELREVADFLSQVIGAPVIVESGYGDENITLELAGMPVSAVLGWVAEIAGLRMRLTDGAILLEYTPEFTIEMYPVGDLVDAPDQELGYDQLEWLVHDTVARETWDNWEEPRFAYWGDLLIVTQMPAVHTRLTNFLDALRRASR